MTEKSDDRPDSSDNVQRIHSLVRMMRKFDLVAIDLVEGSTKIRLRRGGAGAWVPAPVAPAVPVPSPVPAATAPAASTAAPAAPAAPKGVTIDSPMVGTFYAASSPEAGPYVGPGSPVRGETVVCMIEAMKVFTEIPAGISGTIVEVLVKDKQAVEFGQPLFRVEPS